MEIEKIWKIVFDPGKAYIPQVNKLKLIYKTTPDKDKPDAIEATAPGLGNCLDDYLRNQGLPVYSRIIGAGQEEGLKAYFMSPTGKDTVKSIISTNAVEIRSLLRWAQ